MRLLILVSAVLLLAACDLTQTEDMTEPEAEDTENVSEENSSDEKAAENEESEEQIETEPPYDSVGNIDILSPAFYEDYLNNYYFHSYATIERGMMRDEVIAVLGEPSGESAIPVGDVFNDLAVSYAFQADSVEQVLITPQDDITLDEIIAAFGEPTQDLSPEETGNIGRILTYQSSADSNYYITVTGDENDHVSLIHPSQTHNAEVVNESNVMGFIESYYDKNILDISLVSFEEPVLNIEMRYFEVPFVNNHNGLAGHFRVSFFGQVEFINENGEFVYGEFIPYAGGKFK